MACRGVLFALSEEQRDKLLSMKTDDEILDYVQEHIEEVWDEEWLQEIDKAWDAIHRCLTDGSLVPKGNNICEKCILGGEHLYGKDDYVISYVSPDQVKDVFESISEITKENFRKNYFGMKNRFLWFDLTRYDGPLDEEDFEYTWSYFEELREFYAKAAEAGRSTIFTVDQ